MINTVLGISDIHIPNNNKGIDDLKEVIKSFLKQARKIVKDAGGPEFVRIAVCGDLVDMKLDTTNECLLTTYWFLKELDDICPTVVIAGNHDLNMANLTKIDSITPIFEMANFKQTRYLDREFNYGSGFVKDDNVVWCLYSTFCGFAKPDFEAFKEANKDKDFRYIGLIHGEINGATTALNKVSDNALNVSLFDGTDFVIAGHIHKMQEIPGNGTRIVYCSSLKQKNFGETISGHGFVLYDVENNTYEFIETPNDTGSYIKVSISSLDDILNDKDFILNK